MTSVPQAIERLERFADHLENGWSVYARGEQLLPWDLRLLLTQYEAAVEALRDSQIMLGRLKKHTGITDNAGYTEDGRMLRLADVEQSARAILTNQGEKA